jgi:hypothetical protein
MKDRKLKLNQRKLGGEKDSNMVKNVAAIPELMKLLNRTDIDL